MPDLSPLFWLGVGSPAKTDYRKKASLILTSLLEGLDVDLLNENLGGSQRILWFNLFSFSPFWLLWMVGFSICFKPEVGTQLLAKDQFGQSRVVGSCVFSNHFCDTFGNLLNKWGW